MSKPEHQLKIMVYFNGAGPRDYLRASAAGDVLKNLLVSHGYSDSHISHDAEIFQPEPGKLVEPYGRIYFVVTRPKTHLKAIATE